MQGVFSPPRGLHMSIGTHDLNLHYIALASEQDQCKNPAWPPPLMISITDGATEKASKQVWQHPA